MTTLTPPDANKDNQLRRTLEFHSKWITDNQGRALPKSLELNQQAEQLSHTEQPSEETRTFFTGYERYSNAEITLVNDEDIRIATDASLNEAIISDSNEANIIPIPDDVYDEVKEGIEAITETPNQSWIEGITDERPEVSEKPLEIPNDITEEDPAGTLEVYATANTEDPASVQIVTQAKDHLTSTTEKLGEVIANLYKIGISGEHIDVGKQELTNNFGQIASLSRQAASAREWITQFRVKHFTESPLAVLSTVLSEVEQLQIPAGTCFEGLEENSEATLLEFTQHVASIATKVHKLNSRQERNFEEDNRPISDLKASLNSIGLPAKKAILNGNRGEKVDIQTFINEEYGDISQLSRAKEGLISEVLQGINFTEEIPDEFKNTLEIGLRRKLWDAYVTGNLNIPELKEYLASFKTGEIQSAVINSIRTQLARTKGKTREKINTLNPETYTKLDSQVESMRQTKRRHREVREALLVQGQELSEMAKDIPEDQIPEVIWE